MGIEYELLKDKTRRAHQLSDKTYDTDFKAIFKLTAQSIEQNMKKEK